MAESDLSTGRPRPRPREVFECECGAVYYVERDRSGDAPAFYIVGRWRIRRRRCFRCDRDLRAARAARRHGTQLRIV